MLPKGPRSLMYIYQISPEELNVALNEGQDNPNDLIGYADFLVSDAETKGPAEANRQMLYQKALLLFSAGIGAIEANPSLLEDNIDLGLAYFKFAFVLSYFGNFQRARSVLETAIASGHETPTMQQLLQSWPKESSKASMDINAARQRLASLGIEFDGSRVVVHCQKKGWARPMASEVCKILKQRDSYTVLVQNLPYFCGPNWREMSGGKPLALECQSIDEVVELLETAIAVRMVDGVLPVV